MGWTTDEFGTRRFTAPEAPGWDITIYSSDPDAAVYVTSPVDGTDVDIDREGIEVFGEHSRGWDCSGVRFTIPWSIIRELVAVQDSRGTR